jgi:HK97 family phage major capsid protein
MQLQELRDDRKRISDEAQAILVKAATEKRETTGEEDAKFDSLMAEVDKIKAKIERQERLEADQRAINDETERLRKEQELRARKGQPITRQGEKADLRSSILNSAQAKPTFDIPVMLPEGDRRAVALTNLAGAIDPIVVAEFETALKYFGPMWTVSNKITTETGASLYLPTINDTGNAGTILAEASTATTADPTFSSVVLGAYKVEAKYVLVSNETLQDSSIPLEPIIGRLLGERIARGSNTMFTTKTNGPTGIATTQCGAVSGKTATATNAFTLPEIIDLVHSIDPAYRQSSSFMMHDNIIAAARKLVDSQNRPLWEPSIQAGQPDRLFGYPVLTNNDMATALATGNKIIIFGALGKYQIRVAGPLRVEVARELFLANDQTAFFGFLRVDGNLLDAGTDPVKWLNLA